MRFETRRQAMDEAIDWLTYYNHRRLHSTLDYISPMQFEQNWLEAQLKKLHNERVKKYGLQGQGQGNIFTCQVVGTSIV